MSYVHIKKRRLQSYNLPLQSSILLCVFSWLESWSSMFPISSSSGIWIDVKMETNYYGYTYGNFLSNIFDNSSCWFCINNYSMHGFWTDGSLLLILWNNWARCMLNSIISFHWHRNLLYSNSLDIWEINVSNTWMVLVNYASFIMSCANIWRWWWSRFKLMKSWFKKY